MLKIKKNSTRRSRENLKTNGQIDKRKNKRKKKFKTNKVGKANQLKEPVLFYQSLNNHKSINILKEISRLRLSYFTCKTLTKNH